ncbi:DUF4145 domain-containing protein [Oceanobacillus kimchii]|uniref:DUF4145 domain-containing protein n=1 Tax=Oceanobacillus kimchii TaxID=746691 RepID=UPI00034C4345|nr:DUF4145 domain-containing protein [Oceanobacillus kimchii]
MRQIKCYDEFNGLAQPFSIYIDRYPDECPICHYSLVPKLIDSFITTEDRVESIFKCTKHNCSFLFIGYFRLDKAYVYGRGADSRWIFEFAVPRLNESKEFSDEITMLSTSFVEIYNESLKAESEQLMHVAGMGYRKSLEFLIKDYLIDYKKQEKQTIENKLLGRCIRDHIDHVRIKELAKRAAWLGNDETHFVRKWENKSITDLKQLIQLVVNWISQEILSDKLIESMPE